MKVLFIVTGLGLASTQAQANTMTFTGLLTYGLDLHIEDGITAMANADLLDYDVPEAAHLDDVGTGYASVITFTMAQRFDAVSFDIIPSGFDAQLVLEDATGGGYAIDLSYDNVLVTGFRMGAPVASDLFNMDDFATYAFTGFDNLDMLEIAIAPVPTVADYVIPPGYTAYVDCGIPCSHFNIDNVTLSPSEVPLPPTAALFAVPLLVTWRFRKRRNAAL